MSFQKMVAVLRFGTLILTFGALLTLGGCDFGSQKTPTGQVIATVGNREITRRELQLEMTGFKATTPAAQKDAERAALRRIIQRLLVANEARAEGVDKDPSFALITQRGVDTLLVHLLETKVASSVPPPTKEEIEQYQETNPNLFAERKIFQVNQIRFLRPTDIGLLKKLEPLKTLDDIGAFLAQNHIPFQRGANTMDASAQNPKLLSQILALPPHEVFVLSTESEVFANEVESTQTVPLVGEAAAAVALNTLKTQHIQEAVARQLTSIIAKNGKSVRMNKEFEAASNAPVKPLPK